MPTRADFEKINALIVEAAALCEQAQQDHERIQAGLQTAIQEGRGLIEAWRERDARQKLRRASAHLGECFTRARRALNDE